MYLIPLNCTLKTHQDSKFYVTCILQFLKLFLKIASKKNINSFTINPQLPEGKLMWLKTQNGIMKYTQKDGNKE